MKYLLLIFLSTLLVQAFGQEEELIEASINQKIVLLGNNLKDDNLVVWNKIVALAGGPGVAQFGVISAVNLVTYKNAESAKVIANLLKAGAKSAVAIPVTKAGAFDALVVNKIKNTTGIFIVEDTDQIGSTSALSSISNCITEFFYPNGVPSSSSTPTPGTVCYEQSAFSRKNLIDTLRPQSINDSYVLAAIRSVVTKGGIAVGNAAIMGKSPVITEGDLISSLVIGTKDFFSFPRTPLSLVNRGLGLLNLSLIIESGLSENGREVRLMRSLLDSNITKGIGIDENTALIVSDPFAAPIGEVLSALGSTAGVLTMDVSAVPAAGIIKGVYEKVAFSLATLNDIVNLTTGNVTFAAWKTATAGKELIPLALPSTDILSLSSGSQWRQTSSSLINCIGKTVTSFSPASFIPFRPSISVLMDRTQAVGFRGLLPNLSVCNSFRQMVATIKVIGLSLFSS